LVAKSTRGATIKLKIIKNYENGQVEWASAGSIDPAGVTSLSVSMSWHFDFRLRLGCAFNENLFYAICDGSSVDSGNKCGVEWRWLV